MSICHFGQRTSRCASREGQVNCSTCADAVPTKWVPFFVAPHARMRSTSSTGVKLASSSQTEIKRHLASVLAGFAPGKVVRAGKRCSIHGLQQTSFARSDGSVVACARCRWWYASTRRAVSAPHATVDREKSDRLSTPSTAREGGWTPVCRPPTGGPASMWTRSRVRPVCWRDGACCVNASDASCGERVSPLSIVCRSNDSQE